MIKHHSKNSNAPENQLKHRSKNQSEIGSKLGQLEKQCHSLSQQIMLLIGNSSKPIQIRVKEWMKKLQSVSGVQLWIRNRNLYLKVMHIMLQKQQLTYPFHKLPPNSSLPKLSLYQVSFIVRQELQEKYPHDYHFNENQGGEEKQNIHGLANHNQSEYSMSGHRSRQKYSIQSKIVSKQIQQHSSLQEPKELQKKITQTIRQSYNFILKNANIFGDKQEVNLLLEQLWNFTSLR